MFVLFIQITCKLFFIHNAIVQSCILCNWIFMPFIALCCFAIMHKMLKCFYNHILCTKLFLILIWILIPALIYNMKITQFWEKSHLCLVDFTWGFIHDSSLLFFSLSKLAVVYSDCLQKIQAVKCLECRAADCDPFSTNPPQRLPIVPMKHWLELSWLSLGMRKGFMWKRTTFLKEFSKYVVCSIFFNLIHKFVG